MRILSKKIIVCVLWAASATSALAAVELNTGSAADFDGLPGVGPALSSRILEARKQGEFKDWYDFMARVKGVKEKAAFKLSGAGLRVNGKPYVLPAAERTQKQ